MNDPFDKYKLTPQVRSALRKNVMEMLQVQWSMDTSQYTCTVEWQRRKRRVWSQKLDRDVDRWERVGGAAAEVILTHKKTGSTVVVNNVFFETDGKIIQYDRPVLC